jgi:hypothetical protein
MHLANENKLLNMKIAINFSILGILWLALSYPIQAVAASKEELFKDPQIRPLLGFISDVTSLDAYFYSVRDYEQAESKPRVRSPSRGSGLAFKLLVNHKLLKPRVRSPQAEGQVSSRGSGLAFKLLVNHKLLKLPPQ